MGERVEKGWRGEVEPFVAIRFWLRRVAVELGLRRISSTIEDALLALLWC
jgi:hypothetical protein